MECDDVTYFAIACRPTLHAGYVLHQGILLEMTMQGQGGAASLRG